MAYRGLFITFEGADGVGKSTHVNFFNDLLIASGYSTLLIREPGGTRISESIRDILLDSANTSMTPETELLLYEAARAQIVAEKIRPAIESGKIVICDRFFDSTFAYQGFGRGLSLGDIKTVNAFATNGLVPDRTILFTVNEVERKRRCEKREATDRLEAEQSDFKNRVRKGFMSIQQADAKRIFIVDTSLNHSKTALSIVDCVSDLVHIDATQENIKAMLFYLDEAHRH